MPPIVTHALPVCAQFIRSTFRLKFILLECDSSFLMHIIINYTLGYPFLKEFHKALGSWRPNWHEDEWNMSNKDYFGETCCARYRCGKRSANKCLHCALLDILLLSNHTKSELMNFFLCFKTTNKDEGIVLTM